MPITVLCKCGARFDVPDNYAGRTGNCTTCGAPMSVPPPSGSGRIRPASGSGSGAVAVASKLGEYSLTSKLGSEKSTVFLANSPSKGQVAIKLLPQKIVEDSPTAGQRFLRGARAMFGIDHPNLVRCIDAGDELGTYYLVMDYVEARTLQEGLQAKGGRFTEAEALVYAIEAAKGVACLQDKGLVHRNIKPAHILVGGGGLVKLCGMGLLRMTDTKQDVQVTGAGVIVGTPQYMSPEQAMASGELDTRSDLYSLGTTLYEMVAGEPPFFDKVPSRVVAKLVREEVPPVKSKNPAVSDALSAVLDKLLKKEPDERYQDAHDLVTDLESIRGGNLTDGLPPTLAGKGGKKPRKGKAQGGSKDDPSKKLTLVIGALIAVVVVLLIVVLVLASKG